MLKRVVEHANGLLNYREPGTPPPALFEGGEEEKSPFDPILPPYEIIA